MSDTSQSHWTAACRLMQSSLTGNKADRDFFSNHFFAHNSPVEWEFLLISYFGFFQTYLTSFNDKIEHAEIENLWLELWSVWKEASQSPTRIKEFPLLEVTMASVFKGTFMGDVSDTNSPGPTQQAFKTMAATQGTAYMLPLLASSFLQFSLEEFKATRDSSCCQDTRMPELWSTNNSAISKTRTKSWTALLGMFTFSKLPRHTPSLSGPISLPAIPRQGTR